MPPSALLDAAGPHNGERLCLCVSVCVCVCVCVLFALLTYIHCGAPRACRFKLRTTIKMPDGGGGVLDIVTRIYSTPSRLLLVELVRRGGPLVAFQDMYHEIVAVLAESVAAPPPPPPLEACA